MTRDTEILIVGAGPTGLGAAWRLEARAHRDWIIAEAESGPGGLAASVVDEQGFTWDLGGHVQFSHYGYFDELMDALLGDDGWLHHDRESWIWLRGRFVPYPFQLNVHRLDAADTARAVAGLREASQQPPAAPAANFGEWIDATFGSGIADLFMRPYNAKVWARPPEHLAWDWIGDRVAVVDIDRVLRNIETGRDDVSWGPNNRFRFPRLGGTGAIWRALSRRLEQTDSERFLWRHRLVHVDTARHEAEFDTGLKVRYRALVTTIPLDVLIASSDLEATVGTAAQSLEYNSTHVIGVGLNGQPGDTLRDKCWLYFPEDDVPFYRVTHFSKYSPHNVATPGAQWSLMAEVSESRLRPLRRPDVVDQCVEGLLSTGLVPTRRLVHHTWHRRLERGYPVPTLDRDDALAQLMPALESRDVLSRGRFGAWKYEVSNQDHSFAQGVEAVDRLLGESEEETLHHPERVNARRPSRGAVMTGR